MAPLRLRLSTQLALVLCAISAFSTGAALVLQDRTLSDDLERAAEQRLAGAATAAERLLAGHLDAMAERYRAVSRTPELRANLELRHAPTLRYFAAQLAAEQAAASIVFLDRGRKVRARAGDAGLASAALAVAAPVREEGAPATRFLAHEGRIHALAEVPLHTQGRPVGTLVAVESVPDSVMEGWSQLCGALVHVAPAGSTPGPLERLVLLVDGLEVRVAGTLEAERRALARMRTRLLTTGLLALGLAFAASFLLARRLVRPIVAVQDATERIGRGDLGIRLDAARSDEIGDVARAFNHMARRLETTLGEVRFLAYHDGLTGLSNRRLFKESLNVALANARREESCLAVLFLDLDHFKYVNDTLGHTIGDHLLRGVADRIVEVLEAGGHGAAAGDAASCVSRFGGDEFTVMLSGIEAPAQAGDVADRILEILAQPFDLVGHEVTIGASIGISSFPSDGNDGESLLRNCDTAMYYAKQQGRNSHQFFTEAMNAAAFKRLVLDTKLRRAIEREQLALHYQPKVSLATGEVTGLEALARWRDPQMGVVSPEEFVPLAEDSGLIHEIGDWVLRTALAQAARWRRDGLPQLRVAVNLSAHQMDEDGLVERVAALLQEVDLEPGALELEITETALMKSEASAIAALGALRELGVHVSLDDFGTGYSSLSYLRRLPIDTVKIDQSFVRGLGRDPRDDELAGAMISLVKVLGLRVLVEGVETEEQRAILCELGCDEIQGFLVSAAVPVDEVPGLVQGLVGGRAKKRRGPRP